MKSSVSRKTARKPPAPAAEGGPRTDRRIKRTKELLSRALIGLILEKGYEKVSVQDILDRADVGRSTFYSHFENKEQLLFSGPRNMGHFLFGEDEGPSAGFRPLFEHIGQNLPLAKALLGKNGGDVFLAFVRAQLASALRSRHKARQPKTDKGKSLFSCVVNAAAAAVGALLSSWVDNPVPTVDEVSACCNRIIEPMFKIFS